MSVRLYVGNLPAELDRQALEKIFHESGESVSLKVITDRKTGRCRGFGFVTVGTEELADTVIEKFNGYDFNGAVLKLEKALPRSKGKAGEDGEGDNASAPTSGAASSGAASGVVPAKSSAKRGNKKRSGGSHRSHSSSSSSDSHQPDPRWADQLEQLKQQLLAAQASN